LKAVADSLSINTAIQYLEAHPIVSVIALVLFIVVLIILGKIARWVIRPVLKGVLAGAVVFAALYFLNYKELITISSNWMILVSVGLAVITAIVDLNRKE
jgi:hypothetical protein